MATMTPTLCRLYPVRGAPSDIRIVPNETGLVTALGLDMDSPLYPVEMTTCYSWGDEDYKGQSVSVTVLLCFDEGARLKFGDDGEIEDPFNHHVPSILGNVLMLVVASAGDSEVYVDFTDLIDMSGADNLVKKWAGAKMEIECLAPRVPKPNLEAFRAAVKSIEAATLHAIWDRAVDAQAAGNV
jgi:hypothetical protein